MTTAVSGFDPGTLSYETVVVEDKTLYVAQGSSENAFWVSEKGSGDCFPFLVTLAVLGCTCQSCGGTRGDVPAGMAHECIHAKAAKIFSAGKEAKNK